jgi:hypothetical protein
MGELYHVPLDTFKTRVGSGEHQLRGSRLCSGMSGLSGNDKASNELRRGTLRDALRCLVVATNLGFETFDGHAIERKMLWVFSARYCTPFPPPFRPSGLDDLVGERYSPQGAQDCGLTSRHLRMLIAGGEGNQYLISLW